MMRRNRISYPSYMPNTLRSLTKMVDRSARRNFFAADAKKDTSQSKQRFSSSFNEINKIYGAGYIVGLFVFIGFLIYVIYTSDSFLPASKPFDSPLQEFSGDRARKHLNAITKFGPRVTGSYENDITTANYLLKELNMIKEVAHKDFDIEIELQTSSGSFAFVRKSNYVDLGFTSTYQNITNVVAKISSPKSDNSYILANVHFDTVMNTEGASDDTISCAVLIEIFRAICQGKPENLKHGVIFLFNGAEEGGLSGSHAFVKDHRWLSLVKVVVNIEAAGSGGREFVFQTGPEHPWILNAYASAAKYPYASVVAQEIFQSGVIPSDTDFRVFVQYGNLVGIDIAFVANGYVYHTRYDDAQSIPSGSIQRAGDNIFGLLMAMSNSPYIENPSLYQHGSSVFFDILGVFVVHYPKRLHILMNNITIVIVFLYVLQRLVRQNFSSQRAHVGLRKDAEHVSLLSLFLAIVVILFSWLTAVIVPMALAYFLIQVNVLMTWYTNPFFGLLLYGLPSLFGLLLTHFIGNKIINKISYTNLSAFVYAHLLILATILFLMKYVLSSYIVWLWVIFPFLLLCVGKDAITFLPEKKDLGLFMLHILGAIIPAIISMYHINLLFNFFGPLLGRVGTELPGEYVIAVLSSLSVITMGTYFTGLYHKAGSMKKVLIFIGFLSILPIIYAVSGRMFPYSRANPITPKRLFMQHTLRTFHNSDGTIRKQDSGIWVQPMDYLGIKPLENISFYKNIENFQCDGSYCGLPYYYPMRKVVRKQWYLRGEIPTGDKPPLSTDVYRKEVVNEKTVRFYFDIKGPDHMNLFLTLKPNTTLSDWSMYKAEDGHIYSMEDFNGGETYIVFFSHGYYSDDWKFWLEFKRQSQDGYLAELGIARHYLHGKEARTPFLNSAIKALPDWICDNSWTSNYDSFTLN
ncbi:endoplasmic reticulum metallopeptidase 1-like [Hydractinia symbiolongicarpus]|uniref:endoplasmic reticulum metallopeptidase 1-like n=1 Tax=Hydractinia symbiolongicarpus TaxID=13093 RepID=UPI00254F528C|nr:endoplasmic reticulum metallopeptidase 1-like [Hydractinia symbiolongicarpus]